MSPRVAALVLTRDDPAALQSCLWSVLYQSRRPDLVVIANDGAWVGGSSGCVLDHLAAFVPVVLVGAGATSRGLGAAHAAAFRAAAQLGGFDHVWFLQDDTVAAPTCLEALLDAPARNCARQPTVAVRDIVLTADEKLLQPHVHPAPRLYSWLGGGGNPIQHGMVLGNLFAAENLVPLADAVEPAPGGVDAVMHSVLGSRWVPGAQVAHARPLTSRPAAYAQVVREYMVPALAARAKSRGGE